MSTSGRDSVQRGAAIAKRLFLRYVRVRTRPYCSAAVEAPIRNTCMYVHNMQYHTIVVHAASLVSYCTSRTRRCLLTKRIASTAAAVVQKSAITVCFCSGRADVVSCMYLLSSQQLASTAVVFEKVAIAGRWLLRLFLLVLLRLLLLLCCAE